MPTPKLKIIILSFQNITNPHFLMNFLALPGVKKPFSLHFFDSKKQKLKLFFINPTNLP
jgi:hypothetical protein